MKSIQCFFVSLALALALPLSAFGEIRQAPTMASALSDAEEGVWVVFDLDNTVMMPPQSLGGEEWYDYFVEKRTREFEANGEPSEIAKEKAIDQGLKEWNQFHLHAKVIPVEKETPGLIAAIQSRGVKTMALSARPSALADATVAQLRSIGIDFTRSTVTSEGHRSAGEVPVAVQGRGPLSRS